jgi:hypothetical protein
VNKVGLNESAQNYQQAFCAGYQIQILMSPSNNYLKGKFMGNNDLINSNPNTGYQK